jgi:DNA-binding MarR family transcriptional regulator
MPQHVVRDAREPVVFIRESDLQHWKDGELQPSALLVFVSLMFHGAEHPQGAEVAIADISAECGINRETVGKAIAALEQIGLIGVTRRNGMQRGNMPSIYRIPGGV